MRLKTLRKEPPAFETQGALIRGNRIGLSNNEVKSPRTKIIEPVQSTAEDPLDSMPTAVSQPVPIQDTSSYQAIQTAYLERGIRIRLSPTKINNGPASAVPRRSISSVHRLTTFSNRNPSRTSSVLNYATGTQDVDADTRSFSALQEMSSNGFDTTHHNVSFAQSSQVLDVPVTNDYYSSPFPNNDNTQTTITTEKSSRAPHSMATNNQDPDMDYMSSLLKTPAGQSYREMIRRRAGLRDTFAVHRHPIFISPTPLSSREKSPPIQRSETMRQPTTLVAAPPSPEKVEKDILKHASRLRSGSSKDFHFKSPSVEVTPRLNSAKPPLTMFPRYPTQKSFKSISLEPLELLLARRGPRSASLSIRDLPSIPSASNKNNEKILIKRTKSAKIFSFDSNKSMEISTIEPVNPSSAFHQESFSSMKTSSVNGARQSNSFDSGYYDQSSSGCDVQSLNSSSIVRIPSSVPSGRVTSSHTRRSNATKKVSFYEEPTAVILTTATYV